jgi:uncharacterized protein
MMWAIGKENTTMNQPPLIDAVKAGDVETVRTLLREGADPNTRVALRDPTLPRMRGLKIATLLIMMDAYGDTALMLASKSGNEQITQLLLEHGADINFMDAWGNFALAEAVLQNHENVVRLLLDRGADPHFVRPHAESPLMYAAKNGNLAIMERLLPAGANINDRDWDGHTALWWARRNKQPETVRLLQSLGASE